MYRYLVTMEIEEDQKYSIEQLEDNIISRLNRQDRSGVWNITYLHTNMDEILDEDASIVDE